MNRAHAKFIRDLPDALAYANRQSAIGNWQLPEWRIHFHVPLHAPAAPPFENTNDHLLGVLDLLAANPEICSHLEMETYTWEVLPPELKSQNVVDQLGAGIRLDAGAIERTRAGLIGFLPLRRGTGERVGVRILRNEAFRALNP